LDGWHVDVVDVERCKGIEDHFDYGAEAGLARTLDAEELTVVGWSGTSHRKAARQRRVAPH
jgi:hypothetical protein